VPCHCGDITIVIRLMLADRFVVRSFSGRLLVAVERSKRVIPARDDEEQRDPAEFAARRRINGANGDR